MKQLWKMFITLLKSIKDDKISKENEIFVSDETAKWAKVALERMFEV